MSDMSQKPSREIDELIADKVMGLKRKSRIHGTTDEVDIYTANPYFFDSVRKEDLHYVAPLPYSTNIADAWEVVEKLGRWRGFDFMLVMPNPEQTFHLHTYEAGWYEATNDGPERRVVGDADTAPLAICLAALKAVSQEGQG